MNGAAQAHDITPFVCGTTDARSQYVSITGSMVNTLSTSAKGTSIPGFTCTDIDDGNVIGAKSLIVTMFGTANPTNGPYIYITGTDTNGAPVSGSALITAGKETGKTSTYTTWDLANTVFGLPAGTVVDEIVFQIFPSAKAYSVKLYPRFNGATFDKSTKVVSECPGGPHP
jgi:hypothetical protein